MNAGYKQLVKKVQLVSSLIVLIALPCRSALSQGLKSVTLECKSDNYKRAFCSAGAPIERIRLIEKRSEAACTEGSSFGFSGDSIWVDKGCAAKIEITFRTGGHARPREADEQWEGGHHQGTEVRSLRCTSEQFNRKTCNVEGTVRSVRLQMQRSQTRCQEGTSFGYGNGYIWVDKGCDADFEVSFIPRSDRDRSSGSGFSSSQGRRSTRFTCKSNDYKLGACYVAGAIMDIRLIEKKSRAACTRNDSFGFRNDVVWVKNGCEGEFEVSYRPDTRTGWEFSNNGPQTQTLICKSDQYRQETCKAGGVISDVRLKTTRSRAACKANSSYGYNFDEIWVKDGCEGEFEVIFYPRR